MLFRTLETAVKIVRERISPGGAGHFGSVNGNIPYNVHTAYHKLTERLDRWKFSASPSQPDNKVAVVVTPWLQMAVPFFSVELACALREKGAEVALLYDDGDVTVNRNNYSVEESKFLRRYLRQVASRFSVIPVHDLPAEKDVELPILDGVISENAVRAGLGESAAQSYLHAHPELIGKFHRHAQKVLAALEKLPGYCIVVPGGVYGLSGIYLRILQEQKRDFFTYDSGDMLLAASHRGIAASSDDLSDVMERLLSHLTEEQANFIDAGVSGELKSLHEARDKWQTQTVPCNPSAAPKSDAVMLLNFRIDTAALLRQLAFPSVIDWITEVAEWAVATRRIVYVRQHPCERNPDTRGVDDYGALVRKIDPSGNYVRFVGAGDAVNTYDLISQTRMVLPFTSRTGMEATWLGKPVILGSRCFYRGLGFTWDAASRDEYLEYLEAGCSGKLVVDATQRRHAAIAYFLLSQCFWSTTFFTAVRENLHLWAEKEPSALWEQSEIAALRDAIFKRVPYGWIRFVNIMNAAGITAD